MQSQQQPNCIHCKRYFELGETLPPEGIHIEYKKYYLPIKDQQPKWILLKTIVAFLNSKGGTIFMGVDDSTREVVGLTAQLKEQDLFMLDFAQLLEQIKPQIDLRRKQQVKVRFVPVLKEKTFQGKYVIKIIVKQGNPAKVYHFAQTLKFVCQDKRNHDQQFKVLWGFYRSNMGKVDSIKGTQLLRQVYQKATNPSIVVQTFHPGCNPQPLQVSVRNMNIGFKNLKDPKLRQHITDLIDHKFKSINLTTTYTVEDCKEDDTFILKFKSITDYKQADACITEHSKQIKEMIEGKDSLIDEGYLDNTHFYKIGQEFNPSLRYLRNRAKSRDKSIDVQTKIYKKYGQKDVKSPLPPKPNQAANKTNFKPKQDKSKSPLPTDTQEYVKPKNQFVKNLPKQEQAEPSQDEDVEEQQVDESPQKTQKSPVKQFKAKPQQFPEIGSNNFPPKPNTQQPKTTETVINVMPPKIGEKKQLPVKQIQSNQQVSNQKVEYSMLITDIYEKSYPKLVHYLENSLGNKLDRIPHKIQSQNSKVVAIHFHSLNDIQNFIQGLSTHSHTRKVFHGFGQGKPVTIKIKKGEKIEDFKWASENQTVKQQSNEKSKNKSRSKQSNSKSKPQYTPKKNQNQSPSHNQDYKSPNSKIKSPVQSFNEKIKHKTVEVKGFPFIITNLRTDLSGMQKTHFAALLRQIFKHFCSQNEKVQILNEKTFVGIVGINFQNGDERKHFSDQMQTEIIKYHEFTDFFKGHKVFWGVPSGNFIMHHYKADDKNRKQFKEKVDKLFGQNDKWELYESKFVKEQNKYFLRLTFHPNQFVEAFEKAAERASQSPISDYSSWKEGIVIQAQMNRI